jgi:hypothetical protein
MNELLNTFTPEQLASLGRSGTTDGEAESAPIKLDTIVMAEPGKTISGQDLYNLFQKAKSEGVTATSKMRELKNVTVQTFVSPGPGVVRQATRSGAPYDSNKSVSSADSGASDTFFATALAAISATKPRASFTIDLATCRFPENACLSNR